MNIEINRQKLGVEDLVFGEGEELQTRAGIQVPVTKINAANLPFNESQTLSEVLDTNYPMVDTVGKDIVNLNILAEYLKAGSDLPSGSGGQFVGTSVVKGVQYMAQTTAVNEIIDIPEGTNAFSVDNLVLADGSSISVPAGSVYKIL